MGKLGKLKTVIYSAQDWDNLTDTEKAVLERELSPNNMTLADYEKAIRKLFPKKVILPVGRMEK